MKHILIIIVISLVGHGCATYTLSTRNDEFITRNTPEVTTSLGLASARLYMNRNGDGGHIELLVGSDEVYVNFSRYGQLVLSSSGSSDAIYSKDVRIHISKRSEFGRSNVYFDEGEFSSDIYVVVNDNAIDGQVTERSVNAIYTKWNGEIRRHNDVLNNVSMELANRIILVGRSVGYAITVPVDIASMPLFAIVIMAYIGSR